MAPADSNTRWTMNDRRIGDLLSGSVQERVGRRRAFTLVEVMLSMAVLAIMLLLIANVISATQRSWRSASARLSQFREARMAFDTLTRNLRQATLNTYRAYTYNNPQDPLVPAVESAAVTPIGYMRTSELAFKCASAATLVGNLGGIGEAVGHAVFFQAPLGVTDEPSYENLKNLLCVRGYFVIDGNDQVFLPDGLASALTSRRRLRLMEYQPPAERNEVYAQPTSWARVSGTLAQYLRPVSENIGALIISPRLSAGDDDDLASFSGGSARPTAIAPNYEFDSTTKGSIPIVNPQSQGTQHLLPPVIRVTMIALDDASLNGPNADNAMNILSRSRFTNASNYENDLQQLESDLNRYRINYRIFETSVVIPASKWAL